MRQTYLKPFLLLIIALLGLLSTPKSISESLRGKFMAMLLPFSEFIPSKSKPILSTIRYKPTYYIEEQEIGEDIKLAALPNEGILAKVIYRLPSSWNSSLWINVGYVDNQDTDTTIIAKNSPVVIGDALVGIIDYVGKSQSRVKLITDSGLVPSVRCIRGQKQQSELLKHLDFVLQSLDFEMTSIPMNKKSQLISLLQELKKNTLQPTDDWYLAKGELSGSGKPLWRSRSKTLKGVGFNCDFADEFGLQRDLLTGQPIGASEKESSLPILKVGDLLITTGLDGVFPPGLAVAIISQINPLEEGAYTYSLNATPCATNLDDLSWLYVIPPQTFDSFDQPQNLW